MVRIAEIESGSIAEELSLEIGTRVVRINGSRVRDGIDLTFLLADTILANGANRHEDSGANLLADREVAEMFLGG